MARINLLPWRAERRKQRQKEFVTMLGLSALVGVLIIGVLRNGLNLLGVSPFIQQVVIGVVIALAVTIDTLRRRSSTAR